MHQKQLAPRRRIRNGQPPHLTRLGMCDTNHAVHLRIPIGKIDNRPIGHRRQRFRLGKRRHPNRIKPRQTKIALRRLNIGMTRFLDHPTAIKTDIPASSWAFSVDWARAKTADSKYVQDTGAWVLYPA